MPAWPAVYSRERWHVQLSPISFGSAASACSRGGFPQFRIANLRMNRIDFSAHSWIIYWSIAIYVYFSRMQNIFCLLTAVGFFSRFFPIISFSVTFPFWMGLWVVPMCKARDPVDRRFAFALTNGCCVNERCWGASCQSRHLSAIMVGVYRIWWIVRESCSWLPIVVCWSMLGNRILSCNFRCNKNIFHTTQWVSGCSCLWKWHNWQYPRSNLHHWQVRNIALLACSRSMSWCASWVSLVAPSDATWY